LKYVPRCELKLIDLRNFNGKREEAKWIFFLFRVHGWAAGYGMMLQIF
jgi:hypothetical protein